MFLTCNDSTTGKEKAKTKYFGERVSVEILFVAVSKGVLKHHQNFGQGTGLRGAWRTGRDLRRWKSLRPLPVLLHLGCLNKAILK